MAQTVKNPPAVQEMWVRSLGWEDPLEEEMATHSSILAWEEEPGVLHTVHGLTKSRTHTAYQLNNNNNIQSIGAPEIWNFFNPWVGKFPWRKERLPTPVFWPGEFHELYNP